MNRLDRQRGCNMNYSKYETLQNSSYSTAIITYQVATTPIAKSIRLVDSTNFVLYQEKNNIY